jgi:hypothetical protein
MIFSNRHWHLPPSLSASALYAVSRPCSYLSTALLAGSGYERLRGEGKRTPVQSRMQGS